MAFDERELRTFLVYPPKPARVVVQTAEGPQEMTPGTGRTWASMARSIVALSNAEVVELYDEKGKLLRAMRAEAEEKRAPWQPAAVALPPNADPETQRLIHFSNLLYRATEFSVTLAFEKMVDLFERVTDRSDAIEQRLERTEAAYRRTLNEQIREALEDAREQAREQGAAPENPLNEMVSAFLGGAVQGQHDRRQAPQQPNGKEAHP